MNGKTTTMIVVLVIGILCVGSITVVQQMGYATLDSQYQEILTDYETLSSDYDTVFEDYDTVIGQYQSKMIEYDQLIAIYNLFLSEQESLQTVYDQLQTDFDTLQGEYDILLADYAQLQFDFDVLQSDYNNLQINYNTLWAAHQALQDDYDSLQTSYNTLQTSYDNLESLYLALDASYEQLQIDFDALQLSYDTITTWIGQQILPAQYMIFAEAVRRYYFEDFYVQDTTPGSAAYWSEFTRFCRDVIMHDSWEASEISGSIYYNPFMEVSDMLEPALQYDSVILSFLAKWNNLYSAGQNYWWGNFDMTGYALIDIFSIVQECNNMIDYEFDTSIAAGHDYDWDYIKFPVETLFRQAGDCEDQAILAAAYLESCGFETMIVGIHDPDYQGDQGLYHAVPMIWWDNDWGQRTQRGFYFGGVDQSKYIYDEGWWTFLDTTWDTPFGTDPAWLQWYEVMDINQVFDYESFSYAVCDLDGWVSVSPSGAGSTFIEVSMP